MIAANIKAPPKFTSKESALSSIMIFGFIGLGEEEVVPATRQNTCFRGHHLDKEYGCYFRTSLHLRPYLTAKTNRCRGIWERILKKALTCHSVPFSLSLLGNENLF
jgi:hypothetical protein